MTALCPVCHGELVIGGEGVTEDITLFYWCGYCGQPRDPAPTETGRVDDAGEGCGQW
jgi:hypothetical protein